MNQCDGCQQGNVPDSYGFHRDEDGRPFMVCCKSRYEQTNLIYVVYSTHHMGMDGDCRTDLVAYNNKKAADYKVAELRMSETRVHHEYDYISYGVEEVNYIEAEEDN